jgi:ribonuclease HI
MESPFLTSGKNLTHDIIWLLKQHGFTFQQNNTSQIICIPDKIGTPIKEIMNPLFYNKHRHNLHTYNIMFVEQVLNASKSKTLTWTQAVYDSEANRRRTPLWFEEIEKAINNPDIYELNTTNDTETNIFLQCPPITHIQTTRPHWAATYKQNDILLGMKKRNLTNNQVQYTHYIQENNSSPLTRCPGCQHHEGTNTNNCLFTSTKQVAVKIPVEKSTVSSTKLGPTTKRPLRHLRATPDSIRIALNKIQTENSYDSQHPEIIIDEGADLYDRIENLFKGDIQDLYKLHHIALTLKNIQTATVYTDGSLSTWRNKPKMGFGWIILTANNQEHKFQGQTTMHASSSRAEIMAILTAISMFPKNCNLTIFTDSQVAIDGIKTTKQQAVKTNAKKLKNHHMLQQIHEIRLAQNITLNIQKVAAHTGIPLNEKADELACINPHRAGMDPDTHILEFNQSNITQTPIQTQWDRLNCEIPIKEICKIISESKQLAHWRLLNRTRCLFYEADLAQIYWKATYKCLHNTSINDPTTSSHDQQFRKFSLQLWNGELPTKLKLFSRKPDLYEDNKCIYCQQIEDNTHPFLCPNNQINMEQYTHEYILNASNKYMTTDQLHKLKLLLNQKPLFTSGRVFKQFICGAISNTLYYTLHQAIDNTTLVYKLLEQITSHIKAILWEIWKTRCEDFHNWKIIKGITKKKEKAHKYRQQNIDPFFKEQNETTKNKWTTLVNITTNNFLKYNVKTFNLFKINLCASYALAR